MYKCCSVNRIYYSTALGEVTTPEAATYIGVPCATRHDRVFFDEYCTISNCSNTN